MNKTLVLPFVICGIAFAQESEDSVKFITAEQVKAMWIRKLPQPRALDKNYYKIKESYREFIQEIKDGKLDLEAEETAATYNKAKAIKAKDYDLAQMYEDELKRVAETKIAMAQIKARKIRDLHSQMLQAELMSIDRQLRNIDTTLRGQ